MFPYFVVSDTNYDSITCNSNPLLWLLPRCNEDPDCRNPRGFRIVWALARAPDLHSDTYQLETSSKNNTKHIKEVPDELSSRALKHRYMACYGTRLSRISNLESRISTTKIRHFKMAITPEPFKVKFIPDHHSIDICLNF